jgi:cell shape-determining protein MreC
VTVGSSQSAFAELESQVSALKSEVAKKEQTERQLMEMKDRNAALEEQLSEYAGAVRDQSKVRPSLVLY